ncbi:helix-hairpin-helix domain-containing protein [Streptomyces galilaeus]
MTTGPGGFWTRADNDGSFYPVAVDAPTDRSRSTGESAGLAEEPDLADDLERIKGIGPKAAALLHEVGVTKYAHIAGRSPAELASLVSVTGIGAERIARQDWVGQAAQMAATAAPPEPRAARVRHSFTVTVTGEPASGEVLGCEISHHQTEDGTVLRGWDTDGLTAFVQERTGLRLGPP